MFIDVTNMIVSQLSRNRDLIRFNVVSAVPQELQNLYNLMEVEFDPLHLCTRMQTHIEWIQGHPELGKYRSCSHLKLCCIIIV